MASVNCKSVTKCEGSDRLEDDFTAQIFCDMAEQDEAIQFPQELQQPPQELQQPPQELQQPPEALDQVQELKPPQVD